MTDIKPVAWTSKKGLRHLATMGFLAVGKREDRERNMPLYGPEAADEITRLHTLLSEAEKREKEARAGWAFADGDLVRKKSGSWWEGRVVGTYSTEQTPRGYAVQLDKPFGPVQIYPESALESAPQSEGR